ncbi:GpE family phage tail protein [Arsenophonus nasoniae]|uniref:GpE family phage tail protein n=1 Tax=Arsenophonus nasoniae TaxID=638 RepID=A0ABY8NVK2_9GAMM|nr:GpE family phage tail protein [Arsenophonus nasoniae]WGM07674.1 GpE family phage tail protein [Arsenophonus nasoniae]WGM12571.1 GpE family phage tail protein [Arsenophonus nasoniae]WGM17241.1 GpE family phage tail protein [Arsenophonus nasoniae]
MRKAEALLARWFRWPPSEIERLAVEEFEGYLKEAGEQIKREYGE